MGVMLGFAPWILFWVLLSDDSFRIAALVSFAAAVLINLRGFKRKNVKILDLGSMVFFFIIAAISLFADPAWLERWLHVLGNAALTVIVVVSILMGRPFTIQYAKEQVHEDYWDTPGFYSTNLKISWVWFATFTVQTASSILTVRVPQHETLFSWLIPIGAFVAAIKFTAWYPEQVRARAAKT